ncbi:MAG: histidinol-phosphatase [Odoribacteraceae bacterium]|jgi:histidinol-phosphatase (PHP family)|nr:histidinol-phosphatase [Odoribacteraceae bacterium]
MDLSNYHSHCDFCDGKAPMEEFVKAAIAGGFRGYGISSHSPMPFDVPCAIRREKVPDYLAEVTRLKHAYAGQIELHAGMEIDYLDETYGPSAPYFQELPLDYRIGSIHYVTHPASGQRMDIDGSETRFRSALEEIFGGNLAEMVNAYYDASERMVELGGFDFIAHPDKVIMNASRHDASLAESRWYIDRVNAYLEKIAANGRMIEINTKAFPAWGIIFPARRHLQRIRELHIPVMVNSDAHVPSAINEGRAAAFELLREAGFRHTMHLTGGKWTETPIS